MNKKILTIICILIILIFSYCYICSIDSIPNNIIILEGDKLNLKIAAGLSLNNSKDDTVLTASNINKEKICTTGSTNLNLKLGNIKVKTINVDVIPKTKVIPLRRCNWNEIVY